MNPCTKVQHRRFEALLGIVLPVPETVQLAPGQVFVEYDGNTIGLSVWKVDLVPLLEVDPVPDPLKCGHGLEEGCCVYLRESAAGHSCTRYTGHRATSLQGLAVRTRRVPSQLYPACMIYQGAEEPDKGARIDVRV